MGTVRTGKKQRISLSGSTVGILTITQGDSPATYPFERTSFVLVYPVTCEAESEASVETKGIAAREKQHVDLPPKP